MDYKPERTSTRSPGDDEMTAEQKRQAEWVHQQLLARLFPDKPRVRFQSMKDYDPLTWRE